MQNRAELFTAKFFMTPPAYAFENWSEFPTSAADLKLFMDSPAGTVYRNHVNELCQRLSTYVKHYIIPASVSLEECKQDDEDEHVYLKNIVKFNKQFDDKLESEDERAVKIDLYKNGIRSLNRIVNIASVDALDQEQSINHQRNVCLIRDIVAELGNTCSTGIAKKIKDTGDLIETNIAYLLHAFRTQVLNQT
jgi:predicted HTH domain antitoxin